MSLYDEIVRQQEAAMNLDIHCLFVWGKHSRDCTEHEISEAIRLINTPFGGGFAPALVLPEESTTEPNRANPARPAD